MGKISISDKLQINTERLYIRDIYIQSRRCAVWARLAALQIIPMQCLLICNRFIGTHIYIDLFAASAAGV